MYTLGDGSQPLAERTDPDSYHTRAVIASMLLQNGVPLGPELLIVLFLVFLAIPAVMAYWVYQDASTRGDDRAALWAVAVGGLGYLTFFGGLLAFVIYLVDRD